MADNELGIEDPDVEIVEYVYALTSDIRLKFDVVSDNVLDTYYEVALLCGTTLTKNQFRIALKHC